MSNDMPQPGTWLNPKSALWRRVIRVARFVKTLKKKHLTIGEIAKEHAVSYDQVWRELRGQGIHLKRGRPKGSDSGPQNDPTPDIIRRLMAAGLTQAQIGCVYDVTRQAISSKLRYERRKNALRAQDVARVPGEKKERERG